MLPPLLSSMNRSYINYLQTLLSQNFLVYNCQQRLRNQRPALFVPPNVSKIIKEIWIRNVLFLETLLVKVVPTPKPFWRKDYLGWVWGLYIYIFLCRILGQY